MKIYKPEELKNVEILYEGEYFKPIESYKKSNFGIEKFRENYLISNFGRIYSFISNKCMVINPAPGKAMVSFGCLSDTLSVPRLMLYNFDKDNYIPQYNYYIIDITKPITVDNITNEPPVTVKKQLTEDQKRIFIKCKQKGIKVSDIIEKYKLPYLAAMRFNKEYREMYEEESVRVKRIRKVYRDIDIDVELSNKFEVMVDSVTREQLNLNKFTDIVFDICKKLGVIYSKSVYNRSYQYLNGHIPSIKIYKDDISKESSTTSP